jgi:hypothetical protein
MAGFSAASASYHPSKLDINSLAIAVGNRAQYVFCLITPCEHGGTCFVIDTATTKVISNERTIDS